MTGYKFIAAIFNNILDEYTAKYGESVSFVAVSKGNLATIKKLDFDFIPNLVADFAELPASEDNLGKVVQYTGTTTNSFTHGYFYECVSDGQSTPTYSWEEVEVQPAGSSLDVQVGGTSIVSSGVANLVTEGTYNASSNKIATMADIPSTPNVVVLTQAQYDALSSYADNTEYHIIED